MPDLRERHDEPLPEHVTTPLLTFISAHSLDQDYAHAAARRRESVTKAPKGRRRSWTTVGVAGVFGLLVSVAAVQNSRASEVNELGRLALTEQIQLRRAEVVELQGEVNNLRKSNQGAVNLGATLQGQLADMRSQVSRLEVPTGFSAVRGEGLRITVDSAEGADADNEVRDEDLATLVDGLWAAGAEAIAINEQRLNVLGGIRNTSRAIHVNGNPINAPYVISVIGDIATLEARLLQTSQGQFWFTLVNGLGFRYGVQKVEDLRLPGAFLRPLRDVIEPDRAPGGMPAGEGGAP